MKTLLKPLKFAEKFVSQNFASHKWQKEGNFPPRWKNDNSWAPHFAKNLVARKKGGENPQPKNFLLGRPFSWKEKRPFSLIEKNRTSKGALLGEIKNYLTRPCYFAEKIVPPLTMLKKATDTSWERIRAFSPKKKILSRVFFSPPPKEKRKVCGPSLSRQCSGVKKVPRSERCSFIKAFSVKNTRVKGNPKKFMSSPRLTPKMRVHKERDKRRFAPSLKSPCLRKKFEELWGPSVCKEKGTNVFPLLLSPKKYKIFRPISRGEEPHVQGGERFFQIPLLCPLGHN